jgi:hypothetical protein
MITADWWIGFGTSTSSAIAPTIVESRSAARASSAATSRGILLNRVATATTQSRGESRFHSFQEFGIWNLEFGQWIAIGRGVQRRM